MSENFGRHRRFRSVAAICGVNVLLHATGAFAENKLDADELFQSIDSSVYAVLTSIASKKAERVSDAPGIISVITHDELTQFGGTTIADVIQRLPSLQFIGSHLFPENSMIVRGDLQSHYDNHILILINGRPFRDDIAGGQNATFYEAFPVNLVERIEFIRGPGSVLYGTNAFDGVVNIITKKPVKKIEADITAGGGSFGGGLGNSEAGYSKGNFSAIAEVNFFHDNGWNFHATTVYPGALQDLTGSMKYYKHDLSESFFLNGMGFSLNAFQATTRRGNLGLNPTWQMGGDGQSWLDENRAFWDAGYSGKVAHDYTLNVNVTFNYCDFDQHTAPTRSTENSYSTLGEVSFGGPLVKGMNFILGGTAIERWSVERTGARIPADNAFCYYLYTQIDYTPIDKIKLFTGAQFNKAPDIDGVIVPRIGAIVHATDNIGIKIDDAEAFRSPMPLETSTYFPTVIVGNPLLNPEMVNTADFQIFYQVKKVQSALTLFRSYYSDLIGRTPHPTIANTLSYGNTGSMDIRGAEAEGKLSLTSHLNVEASATYQNEVDDKTLTPKYLAKGGVSYCAPFGLNAGIFNNYYGTPKRNDMGKAVNAEAKAVHLISLNLTYCPPFYTPIKINLFIQNALDLDYNYPEFDKRWVNTLPLEPGRAMYATISYDF